MIDLVCRLRPIMIAVTLPGGVFFLALPGKIGIDWYRGGGCLGILFWLFVFLFGLAGLAYFIPVRIRGQIYHCHGVRCEEDSRLVWQVALLVASALSAGTSRCGARNGRKQKPPVSYRI